MFGANSLKKRLHNDENVCRDSIGMEIQLYLLANWIGQTPLSLWTSSLAGASAWLVGEKSYQSDARAERRQLFSFPLLPLHSPTHHPIVLYRPHQP